MWQESAFRPLVIVHGDDAVGSAQGGEDALVVDVRGRAFHQDVQRAFQHADATFADECGDK